jgi:hypothetical protein
MRSRRRIGPSSRDVTGTRGFFYLRMSGPVRNDKLKELGLLRAACVMGKSSARRPHLNVDAVVQLDHIVAAPLF